MKHNLKVTLIILAMFLITQFIGLYVINHYATIKIIDGQQQNVTAPALPYGFEAPEIQSESDYQYFFYTLVIAFMIAIVILFLLTKFNAAFILRLWFFLVIIIALSISFTAFIPRSIGLPTLLAFIIALPLAFFKVYKPNFIIHNFTELFVYPGIAAVFVPILNLFWVVILLILISLYDMWAVWHSGIMQTMAKYQIDKLNVFAGFFVPHASKKVKAQIRALKKSKKKPKKSETRKIKINLAILGGGDVIFPLIAAGVMLKTLGLGAALLVTLGATLGLAYLFFFAKKKKYYPAMPFITAGIFAGMLAAYFIF